MTDNLGFFQGDERSDDLNSAVFSSPVFGSLLDDLVEGFVICGAAVGIAGAVLLDGTDVDLRSAEDFGPADGNGEEMGITEGDVSDGDLVIDLVRNVGGFGHVCRDSDGDVREGGAADGTESFVADNKFVVDAEAFADGEEGLALAGFGALTIADVDGGGFGVAGGEGGAYAGIHATGK